MSPVAGTPSPASAPLSGPAAPPVREDCWSADATHTLVEAWGGRYLGLNRGNLRQKHWREVADAVNDRHGHVRKQRRTDVQCKNRIDTLKKKFKIERARVSDSGGEYRSPWPFFDRLEDLIGNSFSAKKKSQSPPAWSVRWPVPVGPRSGARKRPAAAVSPISPIDDSSYFLRGYSPCSGRGERSVEEDSESSRSSTVSRRRYKGKEKEKEEEVVGFRELARAVERLGEIYERVEGTKQSLMIELEKQRMQFAKDLEYQRMELFMGTQFELQKMKRAKRSSGDDYR